MRWAATSHRWCEVWVGPSAELGLVSGRRLDELFLDFRPKYLLPISWKRKLEQGIASFSLLNWRGDSSSHVEIVKPMRQKRVFCFPTNSERFNFRRIIVRFASFTLRPITTNRARIPTTSTMWSCSAPQYIHPQGSATGGHRSYPYWRKQIYYHVEGICQTK